jgi:uncharacterized membrane protein
MTLAPLLGAPVVVQLHALAAASAFVLGLVQFVAPKGTVRHRTLGRIWVVLMVVVALSSFAITEVAGVGRFSWIHWLSVLTLVMLPAGVLAARRGRITAHKQTMFWLFLGGLVIAGGFTFVPPRILGRVVFGG